MAFLFYIELHIFCRALLFSLTANFSHYYIYQSKTVSHFVERIVSNMIELYIF